LICWTTIGNEIEGHAMYQPPAFREDRIEVQHALIRAHPLGLLITAGLGGLIANPFPFLIDSKASEGDVSEAGASEGGGPGSDLGTLRLHMARANPQWRELEAVEECLVVFQGPQDYVTPSWYATKRETGKVVPTWNYATVHAWGRPRVMNDDAWLRRQIEDLTGSRESRRAEPWQVNDAPENFIAAQMRGIVGVEISILRIEGKWKMSQNRPEADRAGVIAGFREAGAAGQEIAALVAERGGLLK
jgi:transcriptional regulator